MSDEKFFAQFKDALETYAPEAPEAIYTGMRKKLWWNHFLQFRLNRFNVWYLVAIVGLSTTAIVGFNRSGESPATTVTMPTLKPHVEPSTTTTPTVEKIETVEPAPAVVEEAPVAAKPVVPQPTAEKPAQPKVEKTKTQTKAANTEKSAGTASKNTHVDNKPNPTVTQETQEVQEPQKSDENPKEENTTDKETTKKKHKTITLDILKDNQDKSDE